VSFTLAAISAFSFAAWADPPARYQVTKLTSDLSGAAPLDPVLQNSWGVAFTQNASPFWIADNATGCSTLYDGAGLLQPTADAFKGREPEAILAYAEAAIALCREHNFALWLGGARVQRGWALVELGHIEEGANEIRRGLDAWQVTGTQVAKPYFLALLADAELRMGRCADGLLFFYNGPAITEKLSDRFYELKFTG